MKMAVCVAVLGKENSPKYFSCVNQSLQLSLYYKMHASLDFIEEKLSSVNKSSSSDTREHYLGLLHATEEYKFYGYVTNTKIKFIIAVDAANVMLRDNEIRMMFRTLHAAYADTVCGPVYTPGMDINSKKFKKAADSIMEEII